MEQQELWIKSTMDGTLQPSLFYRASEPNRPLLVGLHTWSFDRFNQIKNMLPVAEAHGFNLLLPEFRGKNLADNPECTYACGSDHARQDIQDAIDYVIANYQVDAGNVFLLGLSGGGHMALLMAGKCPAYFKAVGTYVPITDLTQWVQQNPHYRPHVMACCGSSTEEMRKRSPISYVDAIAKANVKIFHGKWDKTVPVSHSIELYNAILSRYPQARVYLDIFDGGHEIDMFAAVYWLLSQYDGTEKTQVTG